MSILLFDVSYSLYSQRLALTLGDKLGLPCHVVLSNRAMSLYAYKLKRHYPHGVGGSEEKRTPSELLTLPCVNQHVWGEKSVSKIKPQAYAWLVHLFNELKPTFCLFFTDQRLLNTLGIFICQQRGIPYMVMEDGAFRPWTVTLDSQGVNRNSAFRQRPHDPGIDLHRVMEGFRPNQRRKRERFLYLRFSVFLLWSIVDSLFFPHRRVFKHKKYHPLSYMRIFFKENLPKKGTFFNEKVEKRMVIFVPLQLPTDTQLLEEPGYQGNQHLIDQMLEVSKRLNAQVIFKRHPKDVQEYQYGAGLDANGGEINSLLAVSDVVVTVNSTVGLEALIRDKPCVCIGTSFYTKMDYVYPAKLTCIESIVQAVESAAREKCKVPGEEIQANVLRYYQAPGSFFYYEEQDVKETVGLVLRRAGVLSNKIFKR